MTPSPQQLWEAELEEGETTTISLPPIAASSSQLLLYVQAITATGAPMFQSPPIYQPVDLASNSKAAVLSQVEAQFSIFSENAAALAVQISNITEEIGQLRIDNQDVLPQGNRSRGEAFDLLLSEMFLKAPTLWTEEETTKPTTEAWRKSWADTETHNSQLYADLKDRFTVVSKKLLSLATERELLNRRLSEATMVRSHLDALLAVFARPRHVSSMSQSEIGSLAHALMDTPLDGKPG